MPRDGSGVYSLPTGYNAVSGEVIQPSQHNPPLEDLASAMSDSISRAGVTAVTANIPLAGFKLTGIGAATAAADAIQADQVAKGVADWYGDATGTANAITLTSLNLTPTALTNGMRVRFRVTTANTTSATLKVGGLTAKALVSNDGAALFSGSLDIGQVVEAVYSSTSDHFRIVSPPAASKKRWNDGAENAPGAGFASFAGGFYRHTSSSDPVYGGTQTLGIGLNGVGRYRFFESVLSCNLPAGDNFGITDGTRVFHIGNDGTGYYVATSTDHYLKLTTTNGTGPTLTLGDVSGGSSFAGRIALSAHPVCFGHTDTTGATNGIAFDGMGTANAIIRSTSGAGSRTHIGFYKSGGSLVGSVTTDNTTTAYNTTSDERLKLVEGPIESGAIIDALTPFMHRWRSQPDAPAVPGMSAQAVAEVVPSAVTVGADDLDEPGASPWTADWSKLVPVLVAEIKALRERVAQLEGGSPTGAP